MKKCFLPVCGLFLLLLTGCVEKKERTFFAEAGIVVGKAAWEADQTAWIPVDFQARDLHSAQWLYDVEYEIKADQIYLTALYMEPPGNKESVYSGRIAIKSPQHREYALHYRDPDGTLHSLTTITLPERER